MKYVIANWKMNGRVDFVKAWFESVPSDVQTSVTVAIAPPLPYLQAVQAQLASHFTLAAQDLSIYHSDGAHTGEVSGQMLKDFGCEYVIVGHSERRQAGESDDVLRQKLLNAQDCGLIPVFCVGEFKAQREAGHAWEFVANQLTLLQQYPTDKPLIIAYEPIWAIGTGLTATPHDVEEMHERISGAYDRPVLYGGSVNPQNAAELLAIDSVSGALVGGAALKPDAFLTIVDAAS